MFYILGLVWSYAFCILQLCFSSPLRSCLNNVIHDYKIFLILHDHHIFYTFRLDSDVFLLCERTLKEDHPE